LDSYWIYAALHEETKEGWVWLPPNPALTSIYVDIRNPHNNKSVVSERRTADQNFREIYNSTPGTTRLPESDKFIVVNSWYRERLGIFDTKIAMPLDIQNAPGWLAGLRAFKAHPSPAIRVSFVLAVTSVVLGFLGALLGLVSLCKK
jgi:hypothetical protein